MFTMDGELERMLERDVQRVASRRVSGDVALITVRVRMHDAPEEELVEVSRTDPVLRALGAALGTQGIPTARFIDGFHRRLR